MHRRIVIVTTGSDSLGSVLAESYYRSNGQVPNAIVVLPDRNEVDFKFWNKPYVYYKLFGFRGILRIVRAHFLNIPIHKDMELGFGKDWIDSLKRDKTQIIMAKSLRLRDVYETIKSANPDILLSIGAPIIFTKKILDCAGIAINIHNAKLPNYRGHFGTFWEVFNKEKEGYVTVHEMVKQVDSGFILDQQFIEFRNSPSFLDVLIQKKKLGGVLLARLIADLVEGRDISKIEMNFSNDKYFNYPDINAVRQFRYNK